MMITEQGLMKVSRELIAQRAFNKDLITKVGNVEISNAGDAKGFDIGSYLYHSGLNLGNATSLRIETTGIYVGNKKEYQTIWSLYGSDVEPLQLRLYPNKISLFYIDFEITHFYVTPEYNDTLSVSLEVKGKDVSIILFKDGMPYEEHASLPGTVNIKKYTTIYLGIDGASGVNYWYGSMKLSKFIVYKDDAIYYTPSDSNDFHFSKILISDGEYPLTDTTTPVLNHVYKIDIQEVIPTHGGVIIKTQIAEDVYLNIKEIGLYEDGGDKEILFAIMDKLSIDKNADLYYDLFFYVNIYLNVVNTVAFPEIIVREGDHAKHSDLETIEKVLLYVETNLERRIKKNNKTNLRDISLPWYTLDGRKGVLIKEQNADLEIEAFGYGVEVDGTLIRGTEEDYYSGNLPYTIHFRGWTDQWCDVENYVEIPYIDEQGVQKTVKLDKQVYIPIDILFVNMYSLNVYYHVRTSYDIAQRLPKSENTYVIPVPIPNPEYETTGQGTYNLPPKEADYFILNTIYINYSNPFPNAVTSQSVGDHLPQQFYQLEDKFAMEQDNCIGVHNYIKFKTDLGNKSIYEFNKAYFEGGLIQSNPSTIVTENNGNVTGFNSSNFYFSPVNIPINLYDSFEMVGSFKTGIDVTSTQYVFDYRSNISDADALSIYITNKEAFVSVSRLQSLDVIISGHAGSVRYHRDISDDLDIITSYVPPVPPDTPRTLTTVKYYAWINTNWSSSNPDIPQILYTSTDDPNALSSGSTYIYISGSCDVSDVPAGADEVYVSYEVNPSYDPSVPESASNPYWIATSERIYFDKDGFSLHNYNRGGLLNKKLCEAIPNKNYIFRLFSDTESFEGYYKYRSKDDYTLGFREVFTERQWIDNILNVGIGARPVYSSLSYLDVSGNNPFGGTIHLIEYFIEMLKSTETNYIGYYSFRNSKEVGTSLLSYTHLPFYPYGVYSINDLNNFNYKLQVVDTSFTGNRDCIDFSTQKNCTLCVKVNLENNSLQTIEGVDETLLSENRNYTILSKINDENVYFRLYIEKDRFTKVLSLKFTLNTESESVTLSYDFTKFNVFRYFNNNILITIATRYDVTSTKYDMYINNVLVDTEYLESVVTTSLVYNETTQAYDTVTKNNYDYYVAQDFHLANYLLGDDKADSLNYVKDILFLEGSVEADGLYLINNMLDTNFGEIFNIYITPNNLQDLIITCDTNTITKTLSDCVNLGNYLLCKLEAPFYNSGDSIVISSTGYGDASVHLKSSAKVNNFYVTLIPINN